MKTDELSGELLDYWVGKALGYEMRICAGEAEILYPAGEVRNTHPIWSGFDPSNNWSKGGPIIERERIALVCSRPRHDTNKGESWDAYVNGDYVGPDGQVDSRNKGLTLLDGAPTPLIAAMRAYVASKFGDEVPNER